MSGFKLSEAFVFEEPVIAKIRAVSYPKLIFGSVILSSFTIRSLEMNTPVFI